MKILAINKISGNLKIKRFKMPNAAYSNRYPQLKKHPIKFTYLAAIPKEKRQFIEY